MASDREFREVGRSLAEMDTKQSLRHDQLMARQASLQDEVHTLRKELKSTNGAGPLLHLCEPIRMSPFVA